MPCRTFLLFASWTCSDNVSQLDAASRKESERDAKAIGHIKHRLYGESRVIGTPVCSDAHSDAYLNASGTATGRLCVTIILLFSSTVFPKRRSRCVPGALPLPEQQYRGQMLSIPEFKPLTFLPPFDGVFSKTIVAYLLALNGAR